MTGSTFISYSVIKADARGPHIPAGCIARMTVVCSMC